MDGTHIPLVERPNKTYTFVMLDYYTVKPAWIEHPYV
jgi:hypothetical protein